MKSVQGIGLSEVQAVYGGPEARLWELVMGQQIHIGGMKSSLDLADKAGIGTGMSGVDLCCCLAGGMRFLLQWRWVARMTGVDATAAMLEQAELRCREEGFADRTRFVCGDVCNTGLESGSFDFVWGEDAWCYVVDKPRLIEEAARLVRPGGVIAFTDWIEGDVPLNGPEADRLLRFMKFPNLMTRTEYSELLRGAGCTVERAEDTGRFAPYAELYMKMLDMQLTSDALRLVGNDMGILQFLAGEFAFMHELALAGKLAQGIFVAKT